jgi:hypothetical protein
LGYIVWWVLLAMSLVFYRERAFFMDAGFQLFNLINEEAIQVYHYRFVTAIPQLVPFLLMKMEAPLWMLAAGFSAAYCLFYLGVYHLLVHWLKNDALGWVLIFLFTLISFDTFYHIQSEFYLGLTLLLLTFGIVLRNRDLHKNWWMLIPLMITVGFSHKLSIVFFLYLWLFFGWKYPELRHWRYLILLGIFILISIVKSVGYTNWYEAAKQAIFRENLLHYFPNFLSLPSNLIFLKRCLHYYYLLPMLLIIVSIFYIFKKKWLAMGMVWAFSTGFLLLYNISDPDAKYRFYSEVTYLPLTIFVAMPFMYDVLPALLCGNKHLRQLVAGGFIAVMFLRLSTIAYNHRSFSHLLGWIESKTGKSALYDSNRFFLKGDKALMDTVMMEWGVPFTSMHLSALESPDSAKTLLIMQDFSWFEDKTERDNVFFSPFHKVVEADSLNQHYFRLGKGTYKMLE